PSLRSWERDLAVLRTGDGREMPRHLRAELDRLRRRLVTILELIREVEAERDEVVTTNPEHQTSRKIVALCRITRRIAIVAMARTLLIALWLYVKRGVLPAGAEIRPETVAAA